MVNVNIFLIVIYLKLKNRGNHLGFFMQLKLFFDKSSFDYIITHNPHAWRFD